MATIIDVPGRATRSRANTPASVSAAVMTSAGPK